MWLNSLFKCNSTLSNNLWTTTMVLLTRTKKITITRFAIVCSLPRGTPLSSRGNHPPDSNTCSSNSSLSLPRPLDSLCLKHTLLFIRRQKWRNKCKEVEPLWVLMSTFQEKQSSWLKTPRALFTPWMWDLRPILDSRMLGDLRECATSRTEGNLLSMAKVSITMIDLVQTKWCCLTILPWPKSRVTIKWDSAEIKIMDKIIPLRIWTSITIMIATTKMLSFDFDNL